MTNTRQTSTLPPSQGAAAGTRADAVAGAPHSGPAAGDAHSGPVAGAPHSGPAAGDPAAGATRSGSATGAPHSGSAAGAPQTASATSTPHSGSAAGATRYDVTAAAPRCRLEVGAPSATDPTETGPRTHDLAFTATPPTGRDAAAPLALGFAAAAAMWAVGYACRLPGSEVPGAVVLGLLACCVLAAGFMAGRLGGGIRTGALAGAITGAINLLVLGSLLRDPANDQISRVALAWAPGSIIACSLVATLGAALGSMFAARGRMVSAARDRASQSSESGAAEGSAFGAARRGADGATGRPGGAPGAALRGVCAAHAPQVNWRCAFACVAAAATIVLIVAGGVVTGFEAGLAVPDWPASYGYNMFLYPLARMTGGIYFEHTHRLFGSLVGLTTLTLTVYLLASRTPASQRVVAGLALLGVIVQGLLGGFRVTETNIALAISHGILAQLFLATLFLLAAMLTATWRTAAPERHPAAAADRTLGAIALPALVIQLMLGALLRHTPDAFWLVLHISSAVIVIGVVGLYATRVWAIYESRPLLTRLGGGVLVLLGVQLMLGFAALFGVSLDAPGRPAPLQVLLTTAHQTTGALLLAFTSLLVLWHARLTLPTRPTAMTERAAATADSPL